jgi:hypothetical protein
MLSALYFRRAAYHESVQLGHELTQKMNEDVQGDAHDSDGDSGSEHNASGAENEGSGAISKREASKRASAAVKSLLAEDLAEPAAPGGKYKKLFDMDFMKRAAEQQKERARDEAKVILREIEQMEEDYDSDLAAEEAAAEAQRGPKISQDRLSQAKQEVKAMLGSGMALSKGRRGVLTSGSASGKSVGGFEFAAAEESEPEGEGQSYSDEEEHRAMEAALESNPWLQPAAAGKGGKKRKASGTGVKGATDKGEDAVFIDTLAIQSAEASSSSRAGKNRKVAASTTTPAATEKATAAVDSVAPGSKKQKKNKGGSEAVVSSVIVDASTSPASSKEKAPVKLSLSEGQTQADLVQMAFAGPDLEAEFRAFKQAAIDAEHGVDEKKTKILSDGKRTVSCEPGSVYRLLWEIAG